MARWIEHLSRYDRISFCWFNGRLPRLSQSRTIRWLSRSGDGYCYVAIPLVISAFGPGLPYPLWQTLLFGFAIEVPLFRLLKVSLKRARPYQAMVDFKAVIEAHDQFSFPSGHTTAAFMFAGIIGSYYPDWFGAVYLWASLIGLSRVLLGVHYPGDVAAGALLGSALAWFSLAVTAS